MFTYSYFNWRVDLWLLLLIKETNTLSILLYCMFSISESTWTQHYFYHSSSRGRMYVVYTHTHLDLCVSLTFHPAPSLTFAFLHWGNWNLTRYRNRTERVWLAQDQWAKSVCLIKNSFKEEANCAPVTDRTKWATENNLWLTNQDWENNRSNMSRNTIRKLQGKMKWAILKLFL